MFLHGRCKGFCTLPKVSQTWGFVAVAHGMAGAGHVRKEDLERCILHGRCSTRDTFISDVRRSGRERGCILEYQSFRFDKTILRDICSPSHDLASLFPGRRSTLDRRSEKITKRNGRRPSALLDFAVLKQVSQNRFAFIVFKLLS